MGIVSKPGRSGAMMSAQGDPLFIDTDDGLMRLLKYGTNGPIYVTPKQYRNIMGNDDAFMKERTPRRHRKKKRK